MKKIFVITLLFCFLITNTPVCAKTLKGGISYTVTTARQEVFDGIPIPDMALIQKHLIDKKTFENVPAVLNGKIRFKDRTVRDLFPIYTSWDVPPTYSVNYDKYPNYYFYYSAFPKISKSRSFLDYVVVTIPTDSYPIKAYMFDKTGHLVSSTLIVSENESYIFHKDKNLLVHDTGDFFTKDKNGEKWGRTYNRNFTAVKLP